MRDENDTEDPEPDIVSAILQRVMDVAPGFSGEIAQKVELQVRKEYGGRRLFVHRKAPRMSPRQRHAALKDALSNMSPPEVMAKHKISQATVYRLMKNGRRFGK